MKTVLFALAAIASTPSLAVAQQDCGDLSNQAEMNICAEKAFKKSDAELNTLYKQIEGRLNDSPESKKLLVGSQRSWVAYPRCRVCIRQFRSCWRFCSAIHPQHVHGHAEQKARGRL